MTEIPLVAMCLCRKNMADLEVRNTDNRRKPRSIRKRKIDKKVQLQNARAAKLSKQDENERRYAKSPAEELAIEGNEIDSILEPTPSSSMESPSVSFLQDNPLQLQDMSRSACILGSAPKLDLPHSTDRQEGFVLVAINILSNAIFKSALCKICGVGNLIVEKIAKQGLAHRLSLKCMNPECSIDDNSFYTTKRCTARESREGVEPFDANIRIVMATRMLGQGLAGLNFFCGLMNIGRGMKQQSYTNILKRIPAASEKISEECMVTSDSEISPKKEVN